MFLYNYWYVAAKKDELENKPLARTLLGENVVMYRLEDGTPVALEDRCVHRRAPLSMGTVQGDELVCCYHGLAYDSTGACVRVPGQIQVPDGAKVRRYPLVDRYAWSWIWMGDPALADESTIPDLYYAGSDDWALVHDLIEMKGDYRLLVDNLMDLSHLSFLHKRTIGVDANALTPITTERTAESVIVERWMPDSEVPPMVERARGLKSPIDRWQKSFFAPPSTILIDVGMVPAGADRSESEKGSGIQQWVINLITPETDKSTHYFWGHARNYAVGDAEVQKLLYHEVEQTFFEDVEVIEGQQRVIDANPDAFTVDINNDSGPLQTRRLMERLAGEEEAARSRAA